jgi:molybdopterin adenylyltransferase
MNNNNFEGGLESSIGDFCRFGILTVSDRAEKGEYPDESGPAIIQFLQEGVNSPWKCEYQCVPDEIVMIESALIEMIDVLGCSVVITTGGTGPAKRDVTPEATENVCEKILPGFGEQMRVISLKFVPTAILSRQTAGTRGSTLILNLPGRPKAIRETIDEIFKSVPYCVDLLGGPYIETNKNIVDAFRPSSALRVQN